MLPHVPQQPRKGSAASPAPSPAPHPHLPPTPRMAPSERQTPAGTSGWHGRTHLNRTGVRWQSVLRASPPARQRGGTGTSPGWWRGGEAAANSSCLQHPRLQSGLQEHLPVRLPRFAFPSAARACCWLSLASAHLDFRQALPPAPSTQHPICFVGGGTQMPAKLWGSTPGKCPQFRPPTQKAIQ